ncbi:hypothetical protein [Goekera deserti]|uniref:Uncharacterized protein n=1 Tax=Goekera deserti TaxID=2497753 RepID=A0A7K3WBZ9_9ACTN|nr:hypothetical protein [Goekera deserti]NDI47781.1 hypothetical protein [Goekera deserti]NEL53529.1 hypothetical protein [Goekera deserti]
MTTPDPCLRHPRATWVASCTQCSAWHLHRMRTLARPSGAARTSRPLAREAG